MESVEVEPILEHEPHGVASQPEPSRKETQESKESKEYQVEIIPCSQEAENNMKKDNDIYGISKKEEVEVPP